MTEPQKSFKELPEGAVLEPPKSFKELPEGALLESPKSLKELPEDAVLEDDLSIDEIKKMQSEGVPLSEKLQRKLWNEEDKKPITQVASEFAGAAANNLLPLIKKLGSGTAELIEKGVIHPIGDQITFGVMNSPEVREKIWRDNDKVWRAAGSGAFGGFEELVEGATLLATESNVLTDKIQGLSEDERFRRYMFREATRKNLADSKNLTPDAAARMLSENPILKGITHTAARIEGATPEEAKTIVEEQMEQIKQSGLTAEELKQFEDVVLVGDVGSPFAIPGLGTAGRFTGKLVSKATKPIVQKTAALGFKGLEKTAALTEFSANKVLQGAELLQTGAKKIGEYAINDPDTFIRGTVNTVNLTYVPPAKLIRGTARVIKDIARQADVGGTAGRRGMAERAGRDILSSDSTKGLFGPQGKGGVARAKMADWMVRQANAIIQPGVEAGALNVLLGLPFIETAGQAGESFSTGLAIGGIGGSRAIERVGGLVDPRTTMAQKITNLVTPDPTAYRRDEDADIKRFMAQASPDIVQNITDLSSIEKRKSAVDATIANLEKERDAQINPEDAAITQKQIDGFLKQREALSKATPETQAEALRQTQLAFLDAYDLAQSTGGVAGLRGVNIAVLDPANADQFFRNLYGDSLKQAETTINLLTGTPSLTETDSQKLTEARQLLQKFQNDVEGAKTTRGFAIQEDNTDPNSPDFVPPHLRRINQVGATAVINADLIKHLSAQGFNVRHTLQHEVQHAVQQFSEVQRMLAPLRGQLFDQKIRNDDGSTEVYSQGIFSDEDLDRYATKYAKLMSPSDGGASFYKQFNGDSDKMRAYIKDEILAETAAATGEYAGGTRAALDDVGRNVMDWLEVKTKSGRLKQLKEVLRKGGIIFDNAGGYSSVLNAQLSPETLAMVRQYQRGLKDFDGTMTVQQSRESDEPDIPLTKVLGSVALQNKYRHADFFEKEQIIKATAPDGSVTEIVIPKEAKIDPFIDVYRTQGGQLVDANGNVVTLGPEITFGSMPDGTTFEVDTRIARKSNGSPIILTNREMKSRALERTKMIQNAIDSAKNDGSGVRLSDTGNGNYRGVMSPAQLEAFMALPNEVVSPNLKRMTKFFNTLMAKNDGTRVVMEYQAALLNGKYKALSPKIRDEVPIGFQLTKDGNFLVTTISVSRLHDKMMAWADKKPSNLTLWNGDTDAFWASTMKYLGNHASGEKGETGLHPDSYIAGKMKNRINDLFNAYNAETKESNPDRSTLPRARGKDNLDTVIRGRRLDRINNFSESPSLKIPINYGHLTKNYMPAVNPMAAPMTAEEVQNRFDGSVTATRVRRAMATGEIDALESELRQMDDLLPTESLQLVQAEGEMPRIQIVSMFDPENVASLEPEEIVSDIDAETEAELAILDAQDGTVLPQDIAQVLSSKLDQLYADGGRSPIIPALESELEKIYQQLESQAEDFGEEPETTDVDVMNSPMDMIEQAVNLYNSGRVDEEPPQTLAEFVRSAVNSTGNLIISPDVTDEQIVAAADDVLQYRQSLKDRIRSGTRFENAVVAPAGLQYLPAFHASKANIKDKFDINFVNTGSKQQVYGWGLYFAENKKEIDTFYPLPYKYKVDLDIDENKILNWNDAIKERLIDEVEELSYNIEIDTGFRTKIYSVADYYEALSEYLGDAKAASMKLKEMGFDGIKYTDRITTSAQKTAANIDELLKLPKTYNYVIFDDSKIKILEKNDQPVGSITQFMPAEAPSGERGFQSKLQIEIQRNFRGARATPEQLKAVLGNPQNVKPEEVKWSGVINEIDRLAQENNGKVPVQELLDYLRYEGQIKFNEVTRRINNNIKNVADQYNIRVESEYGETAFYDEFDDPLEFDELPVVLQDAIDNSKNQLKPKFAGYQLPGGTNYREVVLSMPRTEESKFLTKSELDEYEKLRFETDNRTPEQQARLDQLLIRVNENNAASRNDKDFTSTHFPDVPNYIAHMRVNERTDAEGNDGLFVEEFQSDRHQAGREKGYAGEGTNELEQFEKLRDIPKSERTAEQQRRFDELSFRVINSPSKGIPNAPFRKDWGVQLFKRALRDAVESGKSWIGWTTGDTQAERYKLSKQIDSVVVILDGENTYALTAYKDGRSQVNEEKIPEAKLSEFIGKELANQAIGQIKSSEQPSLASAEFEGLDLDVGGEGMKGFYDQILPKEIGKYVSKMGGKVEKNSLETEKPRQGAGAELTIGEIADFAGITAGEYLRLDPAKQRQLEQEATDSFKFTKQTPIWRVNITPEMANIVRAGQLQFMPAVQAIPERFTGTGDKGIPDFSEMDEISSESGGGEANTFKSGNTFYKDFRNKQKGFGMWKDSESSKSRPATKDEFLTRVALHNKLFPQSSIEIISFDENGAITKQKQVDGEQYETDDVRDLLKTKGWEHIKGDTFRHKSGVMMYDADYNGATKYETNEYGEQIAVDWTPFDVLLVPPTNPDIKNIQASDKTGLQFMPAIQPVPERFTGTGEKGEERRGRYVAPPEFWTRFDIDEFERGGKFFDLETGEDITDKTYATGTIDVTGKRPSLVSDSIVEEMPEEKGRTWKTNLFRKSAGWEWISENPPEVAAIGSKEKPDPVLISVEGGRDHFYTLKTEFPNGVQLARYPNEGSEPRLRPAKKGQIQLGNVIGRIKTKKLEHPVYDTITIGAKFMPAESDAEYLRLAQDPEANREQLQRMVDDAARQVGGIDVWHKSRGKSYVPKTGNPRYEQSTDDWTVFDPEKATYGVFYASTDKQAVDKWGSSGKTKRFFVFPKKTAEVGRDIDSSSFLSDKERKRLETQGFDSVSGKGAGWGSGAPEIAVFNPNQIKSADPVTYDDEGNVIPLSQRFQTTSPDIRFMPAENTASLSDLPAPEAQQEVEKPLSMVRLSDAPEPPKKYAFAYTTSSDRIPLVDALVKAKNWQAIRDLNQATIRHAMSDLPNVKYTLKDLVGAFENEREISVMPEFEINNPEELAEVRKRMVSLGELWQQTEVLEEQVGGGVEDLLGTVDTDGYLHIGKYVLTFDKLTPALVEKARQASGIQAMSYDDNTVIFYDTDINPEKFEQRVTDFRTFITSNGKVLAGSEANIGRVRSYRNPQSPKAGSLYYNEDPIRLFGEGQLPDRLRSPVYRVVSELLGRVLPPPKDGRASYFVKEDVTPKQVKLQNAIANKQAAVVLNDKKNKDVIKAYEELNAELLKQFDALVAGGMTFTAAPDYDAYSSLYPDSASVIRDIRNNNNLVYLKTTPETFGPVQNGKRMDFSFHPILKDSGRTDASGNKMSYNDILRVVHDAIAHGIYSAQFGPVGEESAWNTHIRTIDNPWARWALTMETRAQNSWVNYQDKFLTEKKTGEDRMPLKKGDKGFIPVPARDYAEQKFALVPLKYALTGDSKVDKPVKDLIEEIGEERADGSPEKDPEWMPSKKEREKIYASIKQPQGTPKELLKQASDVIGKLTRKDDADNVPVIVEKAWAEKKSKDEDAEDGADDGVEDGEVITTSTAVLKDVVVYSLRGTPIVVRPLPNLFAENVKTKVSKSVLAIAENEKKYLEYTSRLLTAADKLRQDPEMFTTVSGYLQFMRESGASGNLLMPPSQIAQLVKDPNAILQLWQGGYHGKKTAQGTVAAAVAGLDSVNAMRDLFIQDGVNLGPTRMITALHHLWGILSRQLDPYNQEALWMRMVSYAPVMEQIQLSIDGKFKLTANEWKQIVQDSRKATKGDYQKAGNNATANANAFHHMLSKHNGKWQELANIYKLSDPVEMTNAFWGLGVGATGIKNKVQRFIGLTFGIHGSVLDRWRFVGLNLPTAMGLTGKATPETYFNYYGRNKTIPEDPVGIYKSYGTVENGNPVFSTALYAGIDRTIQGVIDNSKEMRDFLGVHATPGGFHWVDWNCVKNEAVGHSSLDLTKEFLKRKGRNGTVNDFLDVVRTSTTFTRADQDGRIIDLVMKDGIFQVVEQK